MSTTIGIAVVTYEVDSKQENIKSAMKEKGYHDVTKIDNGNYRLPGGTLWKEETSTSQAISDVKVVCILHSVKLKSAAAVLASDWVVV